MVVSQPIYPGITTFDCVGHFIGIFLLLWTAITTAGALTEDPATASSGQYVLKTCVGLLWDA